MDKSTSLSIAVDRHTPENEAFQVHLRSTSSDGLLGCPNMQSGSDGNEIVQVGILVRDVEETARKLEKLIGIEPFEILEPDYRELTYRGKTDRFKMRIGLARAGPVQIELMQPLYGETIYDEFT